jgi:hypothetical protein
MIGEQITIIIPNLNRVNDLIKTVDFLNTQYKSSLCKVLVADWGSQDGSIQYVHQKSWERRGISVEIKEITPEDRIENFNIDTPFFGIMFPGWSSKNRDFLFGTYNQLATEGGILIQGEGFSPMRIIKRAKERIKDEYSASILFTSGSNTGIIKVIGSESILFERRGEKIHSLKSK